jgi:glycerol-3-phosphate acyltransferase PlsY
MDIIVYLSSMTTIFLGYIIGSIPFGIILSYLGGLGDIRKIGSGNIGATNVLRTGNKSLALLTLLLDGGKGAAAIIFVSSYSDDTSTYLPLLAGFGAFLGHLFPMWLNFQGGKGVATYLGVLFALSWEMALVTCATWLLAAVAWRMSSLAALAAAALAPIYGYIFGGFDVMVLCLTMSVLVFIRHIENIKRIASGVEPKIGNKE